MAYSSMGMSAAMPGECGTAAAMGETPMIPSSDCTGEAPAAAVPREIAVPRHTVLTRGSGRHDERLVDSP
eukprot:8295899-Heterocapsa_arctica.AAC.1